MSPSYVNPIALLSLRIVKEKLTETQANEYLQQLLQSGSLNSSVLRNAFEIAVGSEYLPDDQTIMIIRILSALFGASSQPEGAGFVYIEAGDALRNATRIERWLVAAQLYLEALVHFPRQSDHKGYCLANAGTIYLNLGLRKIDEEQNFTKALELSAKAATAILNVKNRPTPLLNASVACQKLSDMGVESFIHLKKSVDFCTEAKSLLLPADAEYLRCVANSAHTYVALAKLGRDSKSHWDSAFREFTEWAEICRSNHSELADCLRANATALCEMAEMEIQPKDNLQKSLRIYEEALQYLEEGSMAWTNCLMDIAIVCENLALHGVSPEHYLVRAHSIYEETKSTPHFTGERRGWHNVRVASLLQKEARFGTRPVALLTRAIILCREAQQFLQQSPVYLGDCYLSLALASLSLINLGSQASKEHVLAEILEWCVRASTCFNGKGHDDALCRATRAEALSRLAELDIDAERNLLECIRLCEACLPVLEGYPSDYRAVLLTMAFAHQSLALRNVDGEANNRKALNLLKCSLQLTSDGSLGRIHLGAALSEVLYKQGRIQDAYVELSRVLEVSEKLADFFIVAASRIGFRSSRRDQYRLMTTLCLDIATQERDAQRVQELRREALKWVQRSKARTLLEAMGGLYSANPSDDNISKRWNESLKRYAHLERTRASSGNAHGEPESQEQASIENYVVGLIADIAPTAASRVFSVPTLEQQVESFERLSIPNRRTLLIEFFVAADFRIGAFVHPINEGTELRHPIWFDRNAQAILNLVRSWYMACPEIRGEPRTRVRQPNLARGLGQLTQKEDPSVVFERLGREMGEFLLPLKTLIETEGWHDSVLILCTTGILHYMPFSAAHWGGVLSLWNKGNQIEVKRTLIDAHPLVYLPSGALAPDILRREREATPKAYMAAADPFGLLKEIYSEIRACEEILTAAGFSVTRVEQENATVDSFLELARTARVVHLSMHTGMSNRVEFCGVEFYDRRLFVAELLSEVITPYAALAVVTTCSSAHALEIDADDPNSLLRAWMLTGAQSVIGGLWPLDDCAGREFAVELYRQWSRPGTPLAEAFQKAVLHVRATSLGDCFAWSVFVLSGSPMTLLS